MNAIVVVVVVVVVVVAVAAVVVVFHIMHNVRVCACIYVCTAVLLYALSCSAGTTFYVSLDASYVGSSTPVV